MVRPILLDLLAFFLPVGMGAILFALGRRLEQMPRALRASLTTTVVVVIVTAAVSLAGVVSDPILEFISAGGGATVFLSWAALLLLGTVSIAPQRRLSNGFIACLVGVAGCLLVIEGSGSLWWRIAAQDLWYHVPDARGLLQQTSGLTCGPAAATMLLHCYDIEASEGELAYLAGTSLFGSDAHQTASALTAKLRFHARRARARRATFAYCVERGEPFLCHVRSPYLGHAMLVKALTEDHVELVDPLDGTQKRWTRAEFEAVWDGTVIEIVR